MCGTPALMSVQRLIRLVSTRTADGTAQTTHSDIILTRVGHAHGNLDPGYTGLQVPSDGAVSMSVMYLPTHVCYRAAAAA
jgi:hypothetical protein